MTAAVDRLDGLIRAWQEIQPADRVRQTATRLLRVHVLRAGDALQLGAAIAAAEDRRLRWRWSRSTIACEGRATGGLQGRPANEWRGRNPRLPPVAIRDQWATRWPSHTVSSWTYPRATRSGRRPPTTPMRWAMCSSPTSVPTARSRRSMPRSCGRCGAGRTSIWALMPGSWSTTPE